MAGLDDLDVELAVVLGKTRMPLHDLLRIGRGAIVALDPTDRDLVEILANGHPIARGEVVVSAGAISVKVVDMVRKPAVMREPGTRIGGASNVRDTTAPSPSETATAAL